MRTFSLSTMMLLSLLLYTSAIVWARPEITYKEDLNMIDVSHLTESRAKIIKRVHLLAPPEDVFAFLADHEGISNWVPMVGKVKTDHSDSKTRGYTDVGSARSCKMGPMTLKEDIVLWDPPYMYGYSITKGAPLKEHVGIFQVESDGYGGSYFTWYQYYFTKKLMPHGYIFPIVMRNVMNKANKNLIKEFGGEVVKVR